LSRKATRRFGGRQKAAVAWVFCQAHSLGAGFTAAQALRKNVYANSFSSGECLYFLILNALLAPPNY